MNCSKCGALIHEGEKFCNHCGEPVPTVPTVPSQEQQPTSQMPITPEQPAVGQSAPQSTQPPHPQEQAQKSKTPLII